LAIALAIFTFVVTRRDAINNAREQEKSRQREEVQRVVAAWTTTRLNQVTVSVDPDLPALKDSAKKWRESCGAALAILPNASSAYRLVTDMIKEAGRFEAVIDRFVRINPGGSYVEVANGDVNAYRTVSDALSQLQSTTWGKVTELNAIRDPAH
jgi:hypothetical protein